METKQSNGVLKEDNMTDDLELEKKQSNGLLSNGCAKDYNEEDNEPPTFQYLLDKVGPRGWWTVFVFAVCSLCSLMAPVMSMSYQFLGDTPEHWCEIPELIESGWTQQQIVNFAIPYNNYTESHESCVKYNYNYTMAALLGYDASLQSLDLLTLGQNPIKCSSRSYNLTDFQSTTVTEWDLVCESRYLYSTTFSASFFVRLITSPFLGYLIDTFGRRRCILFGTFFFIPCCISAAFAPNYYLYIILRILIAQFDAIIYMSGFVLCLEISGRKQRSMVGVLFCVPWAIGYMLLPGIAYLVRDWRTLQFVLSMPSILLILTWFLPESPRWLLNKGRDQEALDVLKKMAKKDSAFHDTKDIMQKMCKIRAQEVVNEETNESCCLGLAKHGKTFLTNIWELIRTLPMLRLTSIVMYTWFASAAGYYGVSMISVNLKINKYLYMFLGGAIEIPSYFTLFLLISRFGRKKAFILLFVVCALFICTIPILDVVAPTTPAWVRLALSLTSKMSINMAFQLTYLYTGELYHTSQRSFVVSLGSLFSAGGGAVTPYINDLLVEKAVWSPPVTFGAISILAASLTVLLPETKDQELPESLEAVESAVKRSKEKKKKDSTHCNEYEIQNVTESIPSSHKDCTKI